MAKPETIKIHCLYDKLVPVGDLKPNPRNANVHPEEQIERLAEILKYQGWRYPIKVSNRSGLITSGHGRLLAAKLLGMKEVPVNFQHYDSDDQEGADLHADNAIAAWAEIDMSGINTDLGNFGPDFDLKMLGIKNFSLDVVERIPLVEDDHVPTAPKIPKSKLGDLWTLGAHRILCGDSTNVQHVERLMGGEKAVLWHSDPPYGINHVEVANEKGQAKGYKKIANDELQDEALKDFILASISASLPFMKDGFAFYMWHAMKMQAYFSQAAAAAAAGILFHRQIIWVKPQFVFGRGHYHWRHELCLMGWLKGNEPPFYGERNQDTVWNIGRENDKIHPTQKPVAIWEPAIKNHMKTGEIVYEPFSVSGSQIIAAEKNSVRCFAMELEPIYVDVAVQRWAAYTGQDPVRDDGVKWSEVSEPHY